MSASAFTDRHVVARVAHELRTPLTSLKGALELLGRPGENPDADQLLSIARRNADRLGRLVDEILDVERATQGALPVVRQPVEVPELLDVAVSTVSGTALGKDVEIRVQAEPTPLWGDAHRLGQVLSNLLSNAVRFSPPGGHVHLRARQAEGEVQLITEDHGPGIAAADLPRVFDPFWQGEQGRREATSGLGLSIVQAMAEAHGGSVSVASRVGQGTRFVVSLPARTRTRAVSPDRRARAA